MAGVPIGLLPGDTGGGVQALGIAVATAAVAVGGWLGARSIRAGKRPPEHDAGIGLDTRPTAAPVDARERSLAK